MASVAFLLALLLAVVHVFAREMRFLAAIPRSRWLSFASGLSVSYVFVHLLPEMAQGQRIVEASSVADVLRLETHVWMMALVGMSVFYGLEIAANRSRAEQVSKGEEDKTERGVFWLHIGSYGLYNVLIGYLLLHRNESGLAALLLYWLAMALHFFVNDYGLRAHHREPYERIGRWLLAAAVVAGWGIGVWVEVSEVILALLIAFLGGGVVLNVLKEELPEDRKSRFLPFALGAAGYAALLLMQ